MNRTTIPSFAPLPQSKGPVKPINRYYFTILVCVMVVVTILSIPFVVLSSWGESQLMEALQVKKNSNYGYVLQLDENRKMNLSPSKLDSLMDQEQVRWLSDEDKEMIQGRFFEAAKRYPFKIMVVLFSYDLAGRIVSIGASAVLLVYIVFGITLLVLLNRAWKTLQPLRSMVPGGAGSIPSPVMSVVGMFIPFYNFYWVFAAYGRLEKFGTIYARLKGIAYRGPTLGLTAAFGSLFVYNIITQRVEYEFLSSGWLLYIACLVLYPYVVIMLGIKLNTMISDFGGMSPETVSPDRKNEQVQDTP